MIVYKPVTCLAIIFAVWKMYLGCSYGSSWMVVSFLVENKTVFIGLLDANRVKLVGSTLHWQELMVHIWPNLSSSFGLLLSLSFDLISVNQCFLSIFTTLNSPDCIQQFLRDFSWAQFLFKILQFWNKFGWHTSEKNARHESIDMSTSK